MQDNGVEEELSKHENENRKEETKDQKKKAVNFGGLNKGFLL